jgi:hypothetical protein
MLENNLDEINQEELDDDMVRSRRMKILFSIAKEQGQKGINFIRSINIDKEYNKGLSTYKKFPDDMAYYIQCFINRKTVVEPANLDFMKPKPLYYY